MQTKRIMTNPNPAHPALPRYHIVFSDIDGTLLNPSHQLTDYTRAWVRRLVQKEVPFVLVSARTPDGIYPLQRELGISAPIICYSGALTLDESGRTIGSLGLSLAKAAQIKAALAQHCPALCCTAYFDRTWAVEERADSWVVTEAQITGVCPEQIPFSQLAARTGTIHKFLCMGEPACIRHAQAKISALFPDVRVYRSKDTYLEIMDREASKSAALRDLCARYALPVKSSMAFGDHDNDADMLIAAGLGVAMGNAAPSVQAAADIVAPDNRHDGLAATLIAYWRHFDSPGQI